jgi:hypothetical protein
MLAPQERSRVMDALGEFLIVMQADSGLTACWFARRMTYRFR